ncbi:winged helix DNA-binding protein [Mucilaginibacter sp. 21P]|uniref:MarR family winged helix-turn-helix transcriptional regulator n=1 Tax=Mucilaginibacter sp. 21P TaxID=2778902 RepID=UPI001C57EA3F|nr:hypothetical protein [Mucilaginibacter sp. 21P]QXV63766.1 winged helix DNA-binding protein [Mucilaginibacter sp. 21P]
MHRKHYNLLVQLIHLVEELENEHGFEKDLTMQDFQDYLNRSKAKEVALVSQQDNPSIKPEQRESDVINLDKKKNVENNISRLLLLLNRHARNYSKKAFENTPLQTLEELSYLAMLYNITSITKSELINQNFQEKTSGTEVIRRLLANELAVQFNDGLDKRSKRLKITENGKRLLESMFKKLGLVSELLVHNLATDERDMLLAILQKLDIFHRSEYAEIRNMDIQQLQAFLQPK